ncbi:ABC transporter permease [Paraconexibacter sp.]|uniref:ABC transporter permease n=1 Tax=Paraconexibacter sp. TaxID=2949640 RepID=UPI0035643599
MIALLLGNLRYRPGRTLLTALGTAVGVATIVALLAVTDGIKSTAGELVRLGRADLGLFQEGTSDLTASTLPLELRARIEARPGIQRVAPVQLLVEAVPQDSSALVFGAEPESFLAKRLVMTSGRQVTGDREVSVGDRLAASQNIAVGDSLSVQGGVFTVVGVHHSGIFFEDTGAVITLAAAQELTGRPRDVTTIAVELDPTRRASDAKADLGAALPGVIAIEYPEEAVRAGASTQLIQDAGTVIVVMALIIGGIAGMNTMLLATLERRGEFALMSAVGWSGPQVASVVVLESLLIGLIGAILGIGAGVLGSPLLVDALGVGAIVRTDVTAGAVVSGLLVGGLIGVVSGLYPAWRIARLRPAPILAGR